MEKITTIVNDAMDTISTYHDGITNEQWRRLRADLTVCLTQKLESMVLPKFKSGQQVWYIYRQFSFGGPDYNTIKQGIMQSFSYNSFENSFGFWIGKSMEDCDPFEYGERSVFETREKAVEAMNKLSGGKQ